MVELSQFGVIVGLNEYDPDGEKARALEDSIGIKVIRHSKYFPPPSLNFLKISKFGMVFCLFAVDRWN